MDQELAEAKTGLERFGGIKNAIDAVVKKIGKENPTREDFQAFKPENDMETNIQRIMLAQLKNSSFEDFYKTQIIPGYDHYKNQVEYNLNVDYDPRGIVGDDPNNSKERFYGNNDIADQMQDMDLMWLVSLAQCVTMI